MSTRAGLVPEGKQNKLEKYGINKNPGGRKPPGFYGKSKKTQNTSFFAVSIYSMAKRMYNEHYLFAAYVLSLPQTEAYMLFTGGFI